MRKIKLKNTGERLIVHKHSEHGLNYLRHMAAYVFSEKFIPDKVVLDNGAGSGYGAHHLISKGAMNVAGIDVSAEAIAYANHCYSFENLQFKVMDATNLDFPDEVFDVVTSFQVIEHIQDRDKFLREILRVLKRPGVAIISTPNKNTSRANNPFHVMEFSLNQFSELLKVYFDDVDILGVTPSQKLATFTESLCFTFRTSFQNLLGKLRLSFLFNMIPRRVVCSISKRLNKNIDGSDFEITSADINGCLDFIAVCRKKPI